MTEPRQPFTLPIGPHVMDVRFGSLSDAGMNGQTLYDKLLIRLDEELRGSMLQEVLLHECVHVVSIANEMDLTEQQVRVMGLGLAQMLDRFLDLEAIDGV